MSHLVYFCACKDSFFLLRMQDIVSKVVFFYTVKCFFGRNGWRYEELFLSLQSKLGGFAPVIGNRHIFINVLFMKKQYTTPEIDLMQMPKLSIVTASIDMGGGGGGNVAEGNRRGQATWDDDDE